MSRELGAWLRDQREARRWTQAEMARRLIKAAENAGYKTVADRGNLIHSIYRWERGTNEPGTAYRLLYCDALGIEPCRFGLSGQEAALLGPPAAVLPAGQAHTVAIMITLADGGMQVRVTGPDGSPLPGPPGPGGPSG
jgi:transcriptional regulator with XRE-family HTH domain